MTAMGLALAALVLFSNIGASPEEDRFRPFGGALPLWEVEGSPIFLLPGAVMYPAVDTPRAMVAADLDGDGRAELVVGGDYLHRVALVNGKLTAAYLFALVGIRSWTGPGGERLGVQALAAGDLDRDGHTDLVAATADGKLWVFRNNPPWGLQWWPPAPYPVGGDRLWVFDHDGDGFLDVIVGSGSNLSLLRGAGLPGLGAAEPLGELEGRLRAGVAGSYAGQWGLLFLTDRGLWFLGVGQRGVARVLDRGGRALAVGDFTGDGTLDVAVGEYLSVWVYPGMPEGLGEPAELQVDQPVAWLLSGDFNGDGFADLVAGSSSPAGFSVFYGHPERGFLGPYEHGVEVPALRGLPAMADLAAVADFTGDGRDDLAVAASLGHIALFSTQPRGRNLQAIPGSFLLGSTDLNGDAFPDLLTSTPAGGVAVLVNSGWGTFTVQELVGPSGDFRASRMPYLARLGDVTGDGVEELMVWEFAQEPGSEARITVWKADGELLWSQPLGAGVRPLLVLSDQTGDGVRDVVTAVGDKVVVLTTGVDGLPQRREIPWGGPVGPLVGLRDGTVAGLRLAPEVALVLLRGGKRVETGLSLKLAPLDLIACDLNGDGREDLITIGWTAWKEELVMALGVFWGEEGGFRPELHPLEAWPALALPYPYGGLVAADLDGDGKVELAAMRLPDREGNPGGVVVIPWTETGPGELTFFPGCVGTNLLAMDLDGDGRAELLTVQTGIPARLCIIRWEVER